MSLVALTKVTKAYYEWAFFIGYNGSMNYENYLIRSNEYDLDSLNEKDIVLFTTFGTYEITDYNGSYEFEEICYYVANYTNQNQYGTALGFMIQSDNALTLINSNYVDFIEFYSQGPCGLLMARAYPNASGDIRDGSTPTNYVSTNFNSGYNSFTYGTYSRGLEDEYMIFDYTNLKYETGDYSQDVTAIRGENISFYNNYLVITDNESGLYKYGYGRPFAQTREQARSAGYGAGYSAGYVQGQEIGFQNGVNSQGVNNQSATAFSYISQAFGAVNNIMSLEVLPNINLGLCFSIPLVVVLIMTLFKLVRK